MEVIRGDGSCGYDPILQKENCDKEKYWECHVVRLLLMIESEIIFKLFKFYLPCK